MLRLYNILIIFIVGLCCEAYTALSSQQSAKLTVESYVLRAADNDFIFSHQTDNPSFSSALDMLSGEYVSTLSARTSYGASVRSTEQSVRVRYVAKSEGSAVLTAQSHPRHINKIFNFDIVRSSLRVDYYLYTLCRLRI